jgi:hypothetical protein
MGDHAAAAILEWDLLGRAKGALVCRQEVILQQGDDERVEATSQASEPHAKSTASGATPIIIPPSSGHVKTRQVEGELPSTQSNQEMMLPPGLVIIPGSPLLSQSLIHLSPNIISIHSTSPSFHPSVGLTPPTKAMAIACLERTLALVRDVMALATPSTSHMSTVATQSSMPSDHINDRYHKMKTDGWYKYKPDQHITGLKLWWENPAEPSYTAYLKVEMQAGNPVEKP